MRNTLESEAEVVLAVRKYMLMAWRARIIDDGSKLGDVKKLSSNQRMLCIIIRI